MFLLLTLNMKYRLGREISNLQVYGLQKGGVFSEDSLPYLWKWKVHATSQIDRTGIGDVPPKVCLRTALSICYFGNRIGRAASYRGIAKERLPFSYNNKINKQQIYFFLPFLSFLEDLQKLLCSMTCTSIMRSKDYKRAVNQTTKMILLSKWCFILTHSP